MGFIPIFLSLGGFIFLFVMVVSSTLKSKKKQFLNELEQFNKAVSTMDLRNTGMRPDPLENWETMETFYAKLKMAADESTKREISLRIKPFYIKVRQYRLQYNKLVKTKPYSFIARLMGYGILS